METINFRDLVKMIHPDLNPEVIDPGEKMVMAKRHRDNPSFLFSLAVKWGLIEGEKATNTNYSDTRFDSTYYGNNDLIFTCGNVVRFGRGRGKNYKIINAVIVDIVPGKGKRKGYNKVFVVDNVFGKIYHFFLRNLNTSEIGGIKVTGKGDAYTKEFGNIKYERHKESLRTREDYKKARKEWAEERTKENLRPNTRYWEENVWMFARTIRGTAVRVIRTTAKRVYYWDTDMNKERYVNMSSVINVYWR